MSTLSNSTSNDKSMNGLVIINANSISTDEMDVDTLVVNLDAIAPTVGVLSNDTHIATTAWVTSHASGSYVTLSGTQTISGQKTFSNANTFISGNTVTNSIQSSVTTNDINIGTLLTTGDINFATTSTSTNTALNWGSTSNSGILTFRGGSFNLFGTGITTLDCGASFAMDIATGQTSGVLNLGTAAGRTAATNIATGSTTGTVVTIGSALGGTTTLNCGTLNLSGTANSRLGGNMTSGTITIGGGASSATSINIGSTQTSVTSAINIGTVVTGNAPITIGSTASTTQTATHNAITTFSKIPSCSVVPTTANHLCNKTYVDNIGASILPLSNTFTGALNAFQKITFANSDNTQTGTLFQNNHTMSISTNAVSAVSGSIVYPVTLSVTPLNTTTSVQISIPVNIFGFNSVDNSSTVTLTYTGATAYILKNGLVYSGTSSSTAILDGVTTRTWNPTVSSKWAFWAYIGNIYFEVFLDQANATTDTYSIGLTLTGTHSLGGISELKFMYQGASISTYAFTNTHNASIPASQGFSGVDVTPFVTTTLTNPNNTEFSATNDIVITSPSTISLISIAGSVNLTGDDISITSTGDTIVYSPNLIMSNNTALIFGNTAGTGIKYTNPLANEFDIQLINVADTVSYEDNVGGSIFFFRKNNFQVDVPAAFNGTAAFTGDLTIQQDTYPPTSTSAIGYTNSATTTTDPMTNTVIARSNFILPSKGVWLVVCGYEWTSNAGNVIESKHLILSTVSGSTTPGGYGSLEYFEEINDSAGGASPRQIGCISGVIIATASTTIYVNARSQVASGTNAILTTNVSWTRLG